MGNSESCSVSDELYIEKENVVVHGDWHVASGKLRETSVTIFSAQHPLSSQKGSFLEQALQASKIYRHPGILRYLDGGLTSEQIVIVTEEAIPLQLSDLEKMSLIQMATGLSSIIEALSFLHDKGGVSHNNVHSSSIYLTSDGCWKIWNFEFMCNFSDLPKGHFDRIRPYMNTKTVPPDSSKEISASYQHAGDCFSLGRFIYEEILPLLVQDALVNELSTFIEKKVLNSPWHERPRLCSFFELSFFKSEFSKLRNDLINILVLPPNKRDVLIKSLPEALKLYSEEIVAETLAPLLLRDAFFLVPSSIVWLMPHMFIPKQHNTDERGFFSTDIFVTSILPRILRLFGTRDLTIRGVLLKYFEHYIHFVPRKDLAELVLPELLLGIRDTNEDLVASTLRCLSLLVPILGADVVVGQRRNKIFSTSKPKVEDKLKDKMKIYSKGRRMNDDAFVYGNPALIGVPERSRPDGREEVSGENDVYEVASIADSVRDNQWWSEWDDESSQCQQISSCEGEPLSPRVASPQEPLKSHADIHTRTPQSSDTVLPSPKVNVNLHSTSFISPDTSGKNTKQIKRQDSRNLPIARAMDDNPESALLADLLPQIKSKNYSLETMLMEASSQARRNSIKSQSEFSLKDLTITDAHETSNIGGNSAVNSIFADAMTVDEGEMWNEDFDWGCDEGLK